MSVNDGEPEHTTPVSTGPPLTRNSPLVRSRKFLLLAIILVVVVITVSTVAQSKLSESFVMAQQHYLHDVTPVEEADVIFNGGASTPPNHSPASTRALVHALGIEINELHEEKWPKTAAANIAQLAIYARNDVQLLQGFETEPRAIRTTVLYKQSLLLNVIESTNYSILKELKLPLPTIVSRPVSPPTKVP
jgi:hypothetical protein